MHVDLCHWNEDGWTQPLPSNPDATVVLSFGASRLVDDPTPFRNLSEAYPRGTMLMVTSRLKSNGVCESTGAPVVGAIVCVL